MSIVKESKGVDFVVNSEPWSDEELKEFRKLMKKQKSELGEKKRLKIKENYKKVSKQPAQFPASLPIATIGEGNPEDPNCLFSSIASVNVDEHHRI